MKTKITFQNVFNAAIALFFLVSVTANAQTYVYNETTSSGMFIDGDGAAVANPVSDAVNSSANCARSGTGGWKKIEYFPNFAAVTGTKLYFSIYNPNNAGPGQVNFEYTTGGGWKFGGNVTYVAGSATGWQEYSVDLTAHVGNTINKIIIFPSGGNTSASFIDNIYFASTSVLAQPAIIAIFDETVSSNIFIDGGAQVANPIKDAVNSSNNCARSGNNWNKMEFFPTFTPVAGSKLYFSVYNPNNLKSGQLKFDYSSGTKEAWGGNVSYTVGATTGWIEYSLDLADHVGNQINKIWLYLAGGEANTAFVDNIYMANKSTLSTNSVATTSNQVYASKDGKIQFSKVQTNTQLSVFDLAGRLILAEKVNGVQSQNAINKKGIYIIQVKSATGISAQKIIF